MKFRLVALVVVALLPGPMLAAADTPPLAQLRIENSIPLDGPGGGQLATDGNAIIAGELRNGATLVRIDPQTNKIVARLPYGRPGTPFDPHFSVGFGSVWATLGGSLRDVVRIDASYRAVVKRLPTQGTAFGVVPAFGSLWVPMFFSYQLLRVNPRTNRIIHRIDAVGPTAVVAAEGSIWVLAHRANELDRVDPATNRIVARIPLHLTGAAERMDFGEGFIWISDEGLGAVAKVDPAANKQIDEIRVPAPAQGAFYLTVGGGSVWVGSDNGYVVRIDPGTDEPTGIVLAGSNKQAQCGVPPERYSFVAPCVNGLLYAFGALWVVDGPDGAVIRIAPN